MQNWEIGVSGMPPRAWLHGDPFIGSCSSFSTISPASTWVRERKCRFEVSKLFNFVILVYFGS